MGIKISVCSWKSPLIHSIFGSFLATRKEIVWLSPTQTSALDKILIPSRQKAKPIQSEKEKRYRYQSMYMFFVIRLWRSLTVTGTRCPTTSRSSWRKMGSSLSSTRYHRGWRWSRSTISALSGSNTGRGLSFTWSVTWPCSSCSVLWCLTVWTQITKKKQITAIWLK